MIFLAFLIIHYDNAGKKVRINFREWVLLILGSLFILYTFLYNYTKIIISGGFTKDFLNLATNSEFIKIVNSFIPTSYNWILFIIGEGLILGAITIFYLRYGRK
jgi:hypothetical protein